jgi:hypothetical protein
MTKVGLYAIGTSTTLESNKNHALLSEPNCLRFSGLGELYRLNAHYPYTKIV